MGSTLRVVLVRPRDPNNIGAVARAMANFGLTDLRVVAPYAPVWREAKSAIGAEPLLRKAVEAATIPEAAGGCREVWATSAVKGRKPGLPVLELPALERPRGPIAVLFGPEKTGLAADDLAYASKLVRIPTSPGCPSMNLAAAVAVFCYEWARRPGSALEGGPTPAAAEQKARLWGAAEAAAKRLGLQEGARTRSLKAAVFRSNLTDSEIGLLLELFRRADVR